MSAEHEFIDLDERIASAFGEDAKSDQVADLIREAEAAAIATGEAAEQARTRALDPTLCANDVAAARHQMEDARFRRERLETAVVRLRDRLQELRDQEEDHRRWIAYQKVKAERDTLAEELARVYLPLATQLADLFRRIAANDYEVEHINARALPRGVGPLRSVELVARGLEGWVKNSVDAPRLTKRLRLPTFERDVDHPFLWPPPS